MTNMFWSTSLFLMTSGKIDDNPLSCLVFNV